MADTDSVVVRFVNSSGADYRLYTSRAYLVQRFDYFRSMFSTEYGFAEANSDEVTVDLDGIDTTLLTKEGWSILLGYLSGAVSLEIMSPSELYCLCNILDYLHAAKDIAALSVHLDAQIRSYPHDGHRPPQEVVFLFMVAKACKVDFRPYFLRIAKNLSEHVEFKVAVCKLLEPEDTVDFVDAWKRGIADPESVPEHVFIDLLGDLAQRGCVHPIRNTPFLATPQEFEARLRASMAPYYEDFPWHHGSAGVVLCGLPVIDLLRDGPITELTFYVWGKEESRLGAFTACFDHVQKSLSGTLPCRYATERGTTVFFFPQGTNAGTTIRIVLTPYPSLFCLIRGLEKKWPRCCCSNREVWATTECFLALREQSIPQDDATTPNRGPFSRTEDPTVISAWVRRDILKEWTGCTLEPHPNKRDFGIVTGENSRVRLTLLRGIIRSSMGYAYLDDRPYLKVEFAEDSSRIFLSALDRLVEEVSEQARSLGLTAKLGFKDPLLDSDGTVSRWTWGFLFDNFVLIRDFAPSHMTRLVDNEGYWDCSDPQVRRLKRNCVVTVECTAAARRAGSDLMIHLYADEFFIHHSDEQ